MSLRVISSASLTLALGATVSEIDLDSLGELNVGVYAKTKVIKDVVLDVCASWSDVQSLSVRALTSVLDVYSRYPEDVGEARHRVCLDRRDRGESCFCSHVSLPHRLKSSVSTLLPLAPFSICVQPDWK